MWMMAMDGNLVNLDLASDIKAIKVKSQRWSVIAILQGGRRSVLLQQETSDLSLILNNDNFCRGFMVGLLERLNGDTGNYPKSQYEPWIDKNTGKIITHLPKPNNGETVMKGG